jgi:chemotaxis protein histidine kinase CheA
MDSILQRFRDKFIDEANGLLDRIEKKILDIKNKPASKELIESALMLKRSTRKLLSGRGIGMDVLKKRINDLRGEVIVGDGNMAL